MEEQILLMRILVSLENAENLDRLSLKLCNFLSIIDDEEINVDILHVFKEAEGHVPDNVSDTLSQIKKDAFNNKVKLISKCENKIEAFLQDNLHKRSLVNSHLLEGNFKERIEKHIKFYNYDLLILNPGKKKDFDLIMKGRNTHWIIDNLEIPVLVLPNYLDCEEDCVYDITCFIDNIDTYKQVSNSLLLQKIKKDSVNYVHFGKEKIAENVNVVFSSNVLASLSEHTTSSDSNKVFVLNHKNKGKFMKFLDKGFTKSLINSLNNPLLIF